MASYDVGDRVWVQHHLRPGDTPQPAVIDTVHQYERAAYYYLVHEDGTDFGGASEAYLRPREGGRILDHKSTMADFTKDLSPDLTADD